jgi:hypothetical protein
LTSFAGGIDKVADVAIAQAAKAHPDMGWLR